MGNQDCRLIPIHTREERFKLKTASNSNKFMTSLNYAPLELANKSLNRVKKKGNVGLEDIREEGGEG